MPQEPQGYIQYQANVASYSDAPAPMPAQEQQVLQPRPPEPPQNKKRGVAWLLLTLLACSVIAAAVFFGVSTVFAPKPTNEVVVVQNIAGTSNENAAPENGQPEQSSPLDALGNLFNQATTSGQEVKVAAPTIDYSAYPPGNSVVEMPYCRSLLDDQHKEVYDQLLDGLRNMNPAFPITHIPGEDITGVLEAVLNDNPDIFWVALEYSYNQDQNKLAHDVIINYTMTPEERQTKQAEIDARVQPILDETAPMHPYDKVKRFYDWIGEISEYELETPNSQNIAGAFLDGRTACAGYSRAFQYLCYKSGMPCLYLTGLGDDGSGEVAHAWNCVIVDGVPVYVDVTWGDQNASGIPNDYVYLCATKADMERVGHKFDNPNTPDTDDPRYEYWVVHDSYRDFYDFNDVLNKSISDIANRQQATYFRFSSPEMLDAAYEDFVNTPNGANEIVDAYPDMSTRVSGRAPYMAYRVPEINTLVLIWSLP